MADRPDIGTIQSVNEDAPQKPATVRGFTRRATVPAKWTRNGPGAESEPISLPSGVAAMRNTGERQTPGDRRPASGAGGIPGYRQRGPVAARLATPPGTWVPDQPGSRRWCHEKIWLFSVHNASARHLRYQRSIRGELRQRKQRFRASLVQEHLGTVQCNGLTIALWPAGGPTAGSGMAPTNCNRRSRPA